jgi:hypothetical protein
MIYKEEFSLLKGFYNTLNLSKKDIEKNSVDDGIKLLVNSLNMLEKNVEHFTKKSVYKLISSKEVDKIAVVYLDYYKLYVSYNIPTDQIIINLFPFDVETITIGSPNVRDLYACVAYGICFRNFMTGKVVPKTIYFNAIASFFTSMFMQVFGRDFGLTGRYQSNIGLLKFLISVYVLIGFFGEERKRSYVLSGQVSSINYKEYSSDLDNYDFTDIRSLIKALSEFKVLNGITDFYFMKKMYNMLSGEFIIAMEDFSRFLSASTACSIPSTTIIPRFIATKYNQDEFSKILEISKLAFR